MKLTKATLLIDGVPYIAKGIASQGCYGPENVVTIWRADTGEFVGTERDPMSTEQLLRRWAHERGGAIG